MLFLNMCLCGCVHVSPGGEEERLRPPWSGHYRQLCAELVPCKRRNAYWLGHLQPQVSILNCQHKYANMPE